MNISIKLCGCLVLQEIGKTSVEKFSIGCQLPFGGFFEGLAPILED